MRPVRKAWGYIRDSGGENQDRSLDQQEAEMVKYCERNGIILERVYRDEAKTGSNADERVALWEMLEAIRAQYSQIHDSRRREEAARSREFGVLLWTQARLARDDVETRHILSDLELRGVSIISLADPVITGNETIAPIARELLAFKAKMDLEQISREARRGLHDVVSLRDNNSEFLRHNPDWEPTGRYLGVAPLRVLPVGFRAERVRIGTRRNGNPHEVQRMVPDPATWDRVRIAWQMRIEENATYKAIQKACHLYGAKNISSCYSGFFKNRIYAGIFDYGEESYGTPDDPFVDPAVPLEWIEIEARRREKRARRRRKGGKRQPGMVDPWHRNNNGRLLSGLVVCERCGSNMHTSYIRAGWINDDGVKRRRKPHVYYECSRATNGTCEAGKVNAVQLERFVIDQFEHRILNTEHLRTFIGDVIRGLDGQASLLERQLSALRGELATANRQTDNLVDIAAAGLDTPKIRQRLLRLEAKRQDLADQIKITEANLAGVHERSQLTDLDIEAIAAEAAAGIKSANLDEARAVLRRYISQIRVDRSKMDKQTTVRIDFIFSTPSTADTSQCPLGTPALVAVSGMGGVVEGVFRTRYHRTRLTQEQVDRIRDLYATGQYSQEKLGEMFGIGQTHVSRIVRRLRWK